MARLHALVLLIAAAMEQWPPKLFRTGGGRRPGEIEGGLGLFCLCREAARTKRLQRGFGFMPRRL